MAARFCDLFVAVSSGIDPSSIFAAFDVDHDGAKELNHPAPAGILFSSTAARH
jgi:hypothetical protein